MFKKSSIAVVLSLCMIAGSQDTAWLDDRPVADLKPGVFLFAAPELHDPNFFQTVVLLIRYEKAGAMGVIINKPTEFTLDQVLPDLKEIEGQDLPVFFGGPVNQNSMLAMLHSDKPPKGALKILKDVYYTGSRDILIQMLRQPDFQKKIRIYAGYAGWGPEQLEHEVGRGDWVISYADADRIFSEDPSKVWPEIFKIQEQIEIHNRQNNHPLASHAQNWHPKA
jgi:putative transcriptional regulator